jgi:mono/diheme cytochrome c family protein
MAVIVMASTATDVRPADAFDALARHDYVLHCSGCHRADGAGAERVVPSFEMMGVFMAAEAGREYLIRVPGVAHAPVTDARLAALLNYVADELAGVSVPAPFTEAEVARHRSEPLVDPLAARKTLLSRLLTASR